MSETYVGSKEPHGGVSVESSYPTKWVTMNVPSNTTQMSLVEDAANILEPLPFGERWHRDIDFTTIERNAEENAWLVTFYR